MSKTVVLAEKPSVGRDLARVLNCNKKGNGYFEGEKYVVTWALGHLVTLADPEEYDPKYKAWRIEDLPMIPSQLKLVVIKESGKQYRNVKEQLARKDVKDVIIATDAGREGELVARWILAKAQIKKPLKRLWISSVTDKAIKEGFIKLRDAREYENLYASAVARAEADWIVGINATRALTCKFNSQLSCGRVQTPTLAMISQRDEEIRNFKPRPFYGITSNIQGIKFVWQDKESKDTKSFSEEKVQQLLNSLRRQQTSKVLEIIKTPKKAFSPGLYDLTELQRDANRIYGFSAKETLSIMQKLYENHKVLTYPRTDSKYLTSDMVDTLKDRIKACSSGGFAKLTARILANSIKVNKSFVDDSKVSDHHAIVPTEEPVSLRNLSDKEQKVYNLVVKRFLAVFYPPYEYEQTTVKVQIGSENFVAKGKTVLVQGWKEIYDHNSEEEIEDREDLAEQSLPRLNKGDTLPISSIALTQGQTKPPAPFNEGTLLQAMENPGKYLGDVSKDLIKTLGETGGLGTVATRADIIEKLFSSFLIEQKGKEIFITSKGKQLLDLVPKELKSPILTAQWEQKLAAIAKGSLSKDRFVEDMKKYSREVVNEIKNSQAGFRHDNLTRTKCPDCGKYMLEVNGKKGKMLICQDRECGTRQGIAKVTNARCPNCHKKLELRGEGEGQIFTCRCGHREKLSAFNERKKKEGDKVSKKDVSKFLKEQKKVHEEPMNNALAEALAKLKLK